MQCLCATYLGIEGGNECLSGGGLQLRFEMFGYGVEGTKLVFVVVVICVWVYGCVCVDC
jgi:hypothetical protein